TVPTALSTPEFRFLMCLSSLHLSSSHLFSLLLLFSPTVPSTLHLLLHSAPCSLSLSLSLSLRRFLCVVVSSILLCLCVALMHWGINTHNDTFSMIHTYTHTYTHT